MRSFCAIALIVGLAIPVQAQELQRWSLSGSLNGSSNSDGLVTKAEPTLGYAFNNRFSMYTGIPFYMVNRSSTTATTTTTTSKSGIGNAFVGFRAGVDNDVLNYSSTLELTAPTGDKSRGFSTGRVTADWTNRISRTFSSVTPFGSFGIANTVSDTAFFVRPFTSLGTVGHFEGGATYDFLRNAKVGASAYAVRGAGQQTVFSKISRSRQASGSSGSGKRVFDTQPETVSQADVVNDHGFSTWFGVSPKPEVDFHAGYSRSVNYDFNTFFFGVGFHVSK
jgi:hypothetical protein